MKNIPEDILANMRNVKIKYTIVSLPIFVVLLLVLYIIQINMLIAATYRVAGYEQVIKGLYGVNKSLELTQTQVLTSYDLQNLAQFLNFEKIGPVRYLRLFEGPVAQSPQP